MSLELYMATCLVEAAADLPLRPAGELVEQFLAWLGPPYTKRFPRLPINANPSSLTRPYIRF